MTTRVADLSPTQLVHVGRQAIYDREGQIFGYELLFRASEDSNQATRNGAEASSQVIVNAFTEFGIEQLVGQRLGFVNLTRNFLVGDLELPFESNQAVLEVLETVEVDDEVYAGVEELAEQGFAIALDDFEWGSGHERLLPLASYVKLQVAGVDQDEVRAAVEKCREFPNVTLLAERLETDEDLEFARELGFELFQGYLLGRPQVVSVSALSPSKLRRFELLGQLSHPEVDLDEITSIVTMDPALSFRMLRATRSAAIGRTRRVASVHEAIMLLGTAKLRQWLSLMVLADVVDLDENHTVNTMARARLCQFVAERLNLNAASAFTVGMLVGVGELLSTPLDELTTALPLTGEVVQAMTDGTGGLGRMLAAVRAYEEGDAATLHAAGLRTAELSRDYLAALEWALRTMRDVLG